MTIVIDTRKGRPHGILRRTDAEFEEVGRNLTIGGDLAEACQSLQTPIPVRTAYRWFAAGLELARSVDEDGVDPADFNEVEVRLFAFWQSCARAWSKAKMQARAVVAMAIRGDQLTPDRLRAAQWFLDQQRVQRPDEEQEQEPDVESDRLAQVLARIEEAAKADD